MRFFCLLRDAAKGEQDVMSEQVVTPPVVDPVTTPPAGVTPPTSDDPLSVLSPEARKIFEETNAGLLSALKKERDANKAAAERLATIEKENQERLEKQLTEQGKYKELAEERAKALAEMQPKADQLEAAQATLKAVLDAQIENIPEAKRSLVPSKLSTEDQLEWIAKNAAQLSKSPSIDQGSGRQGGTQDALVELTPEEREYAKKMGVKPEDYAKNKKKPA